MPKVLFLLKGPRPEHTEWVVPTTDPQVAQRFYEQQQDSQGGTVVVVDLEAAKAYLAGPEAPWWPNWEKA